MNRRNALLSTLVAVFASPYILSRYINTQSALDIAPSALEEYCFRINPNITPHATIGMREIATTPEQFLKQNSDVEAVINGIYFGGKDTGQRPLGLAYLAEHHHLATERTKNIRGYFAVSRNGQEIMVTDGNIGNVENYWLVIGTHPLLVTNGKVHTQALEPRYNGNDYRSAIGTKSNDICFAVSKNKIPMSEWAKILLSSGYSGAINLDGGPSSQMAVREGGSIKVMGGGTEKTHLVIFSYIRK